MTTEDHDPRRDQMRAEVLAILLISRPTHHHHQQNNSSECIHFLDGRMENCFSSAPHYKPRTVPTARFSSLNTFPRIVPSISELSFECPLKMMIRIPLCSNFLSKPSETPPSHVPYVPSKSTPNPPTHRLQSPTPIQHLITQPFPILIPMLTMHRLHRPPIHTKRQPRHRNPQAK